MQRVCMQALNLLFSNQSGAGKIITFISPPIKNRRAIITEMSS